MRIDHSAKIAKTTIQYRIASAWVISEAVPPTHTTPMTGGATHSFYPLQAVQTMKLVVARCNLSAKFLLLLSKDEMP